MIAVPQVVDVHNWVSEEKIPLSFCVTVAVLSVDANDMEEH